MLAGGGRGVQPTCRPNNYRPQPCHTGDRLLPQKYLHRCLPLDPGRKPAPGFTNRGRHCASWRDSCSCSRNSAKETVETHFTSLL